MANLKFEVISGTLDGGFKYMLHRMNELDENDTEFILFHDGEAYGVEHAGRIVTFVDVMLALARFAEGHTSSSRPTCLNGIQRLAGPMTNTGGVPSDYIFIIKERELDE